MPDLHWTEARDLLRKWRENNTRKSEEVIYHWESVLQQNVKKLGNETHLVLEQVCIAALDFHRPKIAKYCIAVLSHEFPGSQRVKKFEAMFLEAQEEYDDALDILDAIIKEDRSNSAPKKRKIALLKAKGRYMEAIKELTEYLKIFMADVEAWQELSELYIHCHDFQKAAFCTEELILHNPHNHLLHQRYADIRYTQGGLENVEIARNYYCQALKLNPKNIRALYGLYLTSSYIATSQKSITQKKKEAAKMAEWSISQIKSHYKSKQEQCNIEERLSALQIS